MDNAFRPGCASSVSSTVELSVSCRNLIDADVFSKSDPMVVVYTKEFGKQDGWIEYGRTETIDNTLNPDFVKKFIMDYFFEERQHLKFEVYDIDSKSRRLEDHDFLGSMECSLGEIVSGGKFTRQLRGPKRDSGKIIICAEEQSACREELTLFFEGQKLDKKDWFGKSDPFLAFYKANEDNTYTVVHRTEYIKHTLNPKWRQFTVPVRNLCGGDRRRNVLIKCIDWNRDGSEDLIGEFQTNVDELIDSSPNKIFDLVNPRKGKRSGSKQRSSGKIILKSCVKNDVFPFVDYVQRGTQLNCTISIDFTASNGNPTDPKSLHYINPYQPNLYAVSLQAVGEIIQDYDSDKLFPVLGFGARLPPDGRVSHEFFVNGHASNPFCNGMSGVLEAYNRCVKAVQLYGPTNFAPTINHVARFAAGKRDGSEYFILLILTDGVITDMAQTKEAVVNASTLPLSIIIVGIGNADFDAMHELDGDDVRLSSHGRYASRDIVQFVPFRDFIRGSNTADLAISQARLAKEVLAEVPDQFLSYMKVNNIKPGSWPGARPPMSQQQYSESSLSSKASASGTDGAAGHGWSSGPAAPYESTGASGGAPPAAPSQQGQAPPAYSSYSISSMQQSGQFAAGPPHAQQAPYPSHGLPYPTQPSYGAQSTAQQQHPPASSSSSYFSGPQQSHRPTAPPSSPPTSTGAW